jgi:acetolactate synthase-1/2/3 large subunit
MNGAESLVHTLLKSGVDTCFTNPGTSEMHFVAALDRIPGMKCVLGLFEGVVTGAADGYGRVTGRPAATLLHCGPGLANGLANLHNARRAGSPIVNIVGDQATYHRPFDAPLTADTEGWARGVSAWVRTAMDVKTVGQDAAAAVQAAQTSPGQIASLILPSDVSWNEGGIVGDVLPVLEAPLVDSYQVEQAARLLRQGGSTIGLMIGHAGLTEEGLLLAYRISVATGCRLIAQGANGKLSRGYGRAVVERVPYVVDQAVAAMAGLKGLVLCGTHRPVTFFAYPNKPQTPVPHDAAIHVMARAEQNIIEALQRLADMVQAPQAAVPFHGEKPAAGRGALTSASVAATVARLMPEGTIISDESVSFGRDFFAHSQASEPHEWLSVTGGAIGQGIPVATGAAIGAPGRRVINLQADGSAMYTVQALWTQAREKLDVTTVILSNRKYQILIGELANVGANPGRTAMDMFDLGNPDLKWPEMAQSMGVEAAQTDCVEGFADLLAHSLKRSGPFLIELLI